MGWKKRVEKKKVHSPNVLHTSLPAAVYLVLAVPHNGNRSSRTQATYDIYHTCMMRATHRTYDTLCYTGTVLYS